MVTCTPDFCDAHDFDVAPGSAWCRREHSLRGGETSPRLDSDDRGLAEALFALSDVLDAMLDRKPQPQPNTPRPASGKPTTQRQDRRRGGIPQ